MAKSFKRAVVFMLRVITGVLLAVVTLVVASALFFFLTPELDLPIQRWMTRIDRWGQGQVPWAFRLEAQDLSLRIRKGSNGLFSKHLELTAKDFCVRSVKSGSRYCGRRLRVGASVEWRKITWKPELTLIHPLLIDEGEIVVVMQKNKPATDRSRWRTWGSRIERLWSPLWRLSGSRVNLARFEVRRATGERVFSGAMDIFAEDSTVRVVGRDRQEMTYGFDGEIRLKRSAQMFMGQAEIQFFHRAKGLRRTGKFWRSDLRLSTTGRRIEEFVFDLRAHFSGLGSLRSAQYKGWFVAGQTRGQLSASWQGLSGPVRSFEFINCSAEARVPLTEAQLSCGRRQAEARISRQLEWRTLGLSDLYPSFRLRLSQVQFGKNAVAEFALDVGLKETALLDSDLHLAGKAARIPAGGARVELRGAAKAESPGFQKLVELLAATPLALPAPVNSLAGILRASADFEVHDKVGEMRFRVEGDLASLDQRAKWRLDGVSRFSRNTRWGAASTKADLSINELRLSAPRMDLRTPPRLRPDPRLARADDQSPDQSARSPSLRSGSLKQGRHEFELRIRTRRPDSILIATNLTRGLIPVGVDLVYRSNKSDILVPVPVTGSVLVGRVPVEIFRRSAILEELRLDLLASGEQRLMAHAGVQYLDYDIDAVVAGSLARPEIQLVSQPPLSDDQILAVLLFGRPFAELGDEEQRSVGNLNAALADAALGVSSLFLLTSTPIESLGYDSDRQLVTARVGIGGGASLEFGRGRESSTIGFKKRLNREFTFRSDVERLGVSGERTVSALIEWVKAF